MTSVIQTIATRVDAEARCREWGDGGNFSPEHCTKMVAMHRGWLKRVERELLPSGGGFDSGTRILLDECQPDRIVMETSFHHMNSDGFYTNWTHHKVVVTPAFIGGLSLEFTCTDGMASEGFDDYLHQVFESILNADFEQYVARIG